MFDLSDKTALVTGATGGIGKAICEILHKQGAHVIMTGTREHVLNELKDSLSTRCTSIAANLNNSEATKNLYEQADSLNENGVDILVCNAGITKDNLAMRMKDEEWDNVIQMNLTSVFQLNREAIKKMSRKRFGRIINISSIVGFTGNFGQANYVAAKAGLIGLTKTLALESATRGITVNAIVPGFMETPMTEVLKDEIKSHILSKVPVGKMGTPYDIANAVIYLASNEANYVTGTTLHVNGGMFMS